MNELLKICAIIGITYCLIDIVTPSQIIVNKDNNKDVDIDIIEKEN